MAVRRPALAPTARERMMAAWRASAAPPRTDPTGACHEALAELARVSGRDVGELLDEWADRAQARVYDGQAMDEAERRAIEDVRSSNT